LVPNDADTHPPIAATEVASIAEATPLLIPRVLAFLVTLVGQVLGTCL
jgi:hypothetical protein